MKNLAFAFFSFLATFSFLGYMMENQPNLPMFLALPLLIGGVVLGIGCAVFFLSRFIDED